uniref:Putative acyl-coenzyme a oxidase 3 pristanoyl n=1 Tax=Ixodes ricinus TaxID=34613 RepID=A0A0K8R430_IXORI
MLQSSKAGQPLPASMTTVQFINDMDAILGGALTATTIQEMMDINVVLAAYKWLVCYLLKLSEEKYSTLLSQGQDQFSAKNDAQAFCLRELALTYIEHTIIEKFQSFISDLRDPQLVNVLQRLNTLFGLWSLEKRLGDLYGGGYCYKEEG